jgi:hypothetical protein
MLKALPTTFQDVRYRSRLEARWAFYLSALAIPFQYESEALDLDGLVYVPDFHLPTFPAWLEIKGEIRDDEAGLLMMRKCTRLAMLSNQPVILAFSDPLNYRCAVFGRKGQMYSGSHFTTCPACGSLSVHVRTGTDALFLCPNRTTHSGMILTVEELRERGRAAYAVATAATKQPFGISRKAL